ncbi:hypothetical protein SM0020_12445 [Sinorhizobium meliloti CCNWSX0020]|uniref:SGS domain-containing protein n=1 Tax=Sinorhizobium meliloti CCNWSX0020 TaxID=1107881 RepID=H0FZ55_RHIML|nr:Lar family restriction alleviation protein [Sinorhizobium meliloti]EHK77735.1 hypothetical protein SM0020_12445 [Sinorhizobium meliloti CCNWSX0020]
MSEIELKPCPFCGGAAERIDIIDGENAGGSCICCTVCQASGNVEFGRKENFVSNWNSRASLLREWGEVKQLEWKFLATPPSGEEYASSSVGTYFIEFDYKRFPVKLHSWQLGTFATIEAAKSAAQADYEARIRSALIERKAEPLEHVEKVSTEAAMSQWERSLKRPDLCEKDRVRGAIEAYKRQAFAFAISPTPPAAQISFECSARKQSLPEPADCDWPFCGCDPYADKVIAAIEESGRMPAAQVTREALEAVEGVALDWSNFEGPKRNVEWKPDDQDLIYTAINYRDDEYGDADEDVGQQLVERLLAAWRSSLSASPSPVDSRDGLIAPRGGIEPNWWEVSMKLRRELKALQTAAQKVIDETDAIHDSEPPPTKYRAPYGAITELRAALAAKEQQP